MEQAPSLQQSGVSVSPRPLVSASSRVHLGLSARVPLPVRGMTFSLPAQCAFSAAPRRRRARRPVVCRPGLLSLVKPVHTGAGEH